MKLYFYSLLLLLASTSLWAMNSSTSDNSSTTITPASTLLSSELEQYNLNKLADQNWGPEKERCPLFDAIRKPNLGKFQDAYQNYPWGSRNPAILGGCKHICYQTAVALKDEQDSINKQITADTKHDYLAIGKNSLKEAGYLGATLLLAATAKVMINSIDKMFRPYISLPGATDTKLVAKLSVILLTSAIGFSALPLHLDAIKSAFKAWYYQDTLKQKNAKITASLGQIKEIHTFMEKKENDWGSGSYIDLKSYNATLTPLKDSKQEEDKK